MGYNNGYSMGGRLDYFLAIMLLATVLWISPLSLWVASSESILGM